MIDAGNIVPPRMTIDLLKLNIDRVAASGDKDAVVLLDGFPRSIVQAELFNEVVGPASVTLVFQASVETCTERLVLRGSSGSGRKDDTPEIIARRFVNYDKLTAPAVEWSKAHVPHVYDVDCEGTRRGVWEIVKAILVEQKIISS
eukprot:gnl/Dysnectes_brevis/2757_a3355_1847.p1 GENE.gnl/Dysnectes_brevis/2757_a3355_1847~~gnl/Dysnectes_brevis/2757_a3355_1847.p1  ORF type:complete len:145 (+),score=44.96 gnl/Dysnectes_brevis/2757_a3355_1847:199-633(+)